MSSRIPWAAVAVVTGLGLGGLFGIVSFMTISGLSKGWCDAAVGPAGQTALAAPSIEDEKDVDDR